MPTTPPIPDDLLPGLTVRLTGRAGFEAAVVESVDGGSVTVRTVTGERRVVARAEATLSGDARTRRLVALARTDPVAAACERADYLARWTAARPRRGRGTPGGDVTAVARRILAAVDAAPVPVPRAAILRAAGVARRSDYERAVARLVAEGRLERVGARGGTRYRTAAHTLFTMPAGQPATGDPPVSR